MERFTIERNRYLNQEVDAFYHANFYGSRNLQDNPNYLYKLKNDAHHNWTDQQLNYAANQLQNVLLVDFPAIQQALNINPLTVCVVPRAKADNTYNANQLRFKATVQSVANQLPGFIDGTNCITRHTNTRTTHLRRPIENWENDGRTPYPGITAATCNISDNVQNCNILLVDDIYTASVNIDEDAIQTLLDSGASSVAFYAVGRTVYNQV